MKIAYYVKDKLLKKGADDVLVKYANVEASHVKFSNNQIVKTGTEILEHLGIFANFKGKLVFTSLKQLDEKSADELIKRTLKFVKNIQVNEEFKAIGKGPFDYKELNDCYDKKILDLDEVDIVRKGINKALEKADRTNGVFDRSVGNVLLVGSNKVEVEEKFTGLYFSLRAFYKNGSGHSNSCSRMLKNLQVEESSEEAGELARKSVNPVDGKSGRYDIVFGTMPCCVLTNHFMEHASSASVEAGMSFFKGKLGKEVSKISLVDYGNMPNGYGSTKFDEEGLPSQRNYILKDGKLKTYLHNTSSAIRHKAKTTANAGLINPSPWNIVLEKGKCAEGNVRDIKNGLYISNVWYTRYQNYSTGDFSTIPRDAAFVIENGEFKQAVKNIRISDNMLNILKNIDRIGKEVKQLRNWEAETPVVVPEILVRNVNVSRAES